MVKILALFVGCNGFMVSYSRNYKGVHYPGDIIVAALIGMFIGWAIAKLY